ncbi:proline and serine-rich protein 3 isoform X1 [Micropterus dolomieu]|uniref:proline and serine-rich protein 3 isoform X1 n=1 Tax=Micropterus dolomieu TaxID=147949 RepID=UPI001E8DB094|nr:proline and serine-rich protein 3 isoform X1 [Micropterus dolomieu]
MKSSGPVFTRQNPFQPASRVGTHYHPSCSQSLSKKKKKTALSPVHSNQRPSPQLHTPVSPESQQLFEKSDHRLVATDGQPVFAESWPSTDCGSSPASPTSSSGLETPKDSARARQSTVSSELEAEQDSVLAKYIDRFRHGLPQSREERRQKASAVGENQLPFWWMSPSSIPPSSTPTKTTDKDPVIQPLIDDHGHAIFSPAGQRQHDISLSPCRESLTVCAFNLSDTSQGEFDDTEILHLQERANRLLLRNECSLSDGSIHVSSEGVGCSDFSSPVSVDEPVRQPLIPSIIKFTTAKASSDPVQTVSSQKSIPSLVPPTRPEEDILFQWRLRRKMEQAREWPQTHPSLHGPAFSWQATSVSHPSASGHAYKQQQSTHLPEFSQKATHPHITAPQPEATEAYQLCPPASGPPPFPAFVVSGSPVSQPQTISHVPAHMHLLCDVLPCPIQSSHARTQRNISQSTDESQSKVVRKKSQVPGKPMNTFTDEPICEHMPSPPPASCGAIVGEGPSHHKRSERNRKENAQEKESEKKEKKTAMSFRKQKKSSRYNVEKEQADGPGSANRSSSHQRVPKKVMQRAEQLQQEGCQEFSSETSGDHAPPHSPIHSALGQVVSEVLFPTVDSSPAERTPVSSVSPPCTSSAPPQSSVLPCSEHNSMEVITQLLQEAEDSDEKEFEDDPLLQVLRKQRKWVKEQISEVDSMLNEFPEEQQVT